MFGRAPIAGEAKTRLSLALGAEGAARLYAAFLADTLALAERAHLAGLVDATLWSVGDPDDAALLSVPGASSLPRCTQPPGELGVRMGAALHAGFATHGRALIVGSDAPTLPLALLSAACAALDDVDLVFCPTADGGYVLLGARIAPPPPLFDGVRFSTRHALADTLAGAARLGLSATVIAPWYDVDTPDDLRLLGAHLTLMPTAARSTADALRVLSPAGSGVE